MPELFAIVKVWILDRQLQKSTSGKNWELHLVAPPNIKTRFDKTMNAYNVLQRKILRLLKAKECVDFEQCYTENTLPHIVMFWLWVTVRVVHLENTCIEKVEGMP